MAGCGAKNNFAKWDSGGVVRFTGRSAKIILVLVNCDQVASRVASELASAEKPLKSFGEAQRFFREIDGAFLRLRQASACRSFLRGKGIGTRPAAGEKCFSRTLQAEPAALSVRHLSSKFYLLAFYGSALVGCIRARRSLRKEGCAGGLLLVVFASVFTPLPTRAEGCGRRLSGRAARRALGGLVRGAESPRRGSATASAADRCGSCSASRRRSRCGCRA